MRAPIRIGKAKPERRPAAVATSERPKPGSLPTSATHAGSPAVATPAGSAWGTLCSLASRKTARRASSSRYQTPVGCSTPVAWSAR